MGALEVPLLLIVMLVVNAYVPPRTAMVPPADTRLTAFWIVLNGADSVPALPSLPPGATYSVVAAWAGLGIVAAAQARAVALIPMVSARSRRCPCCCFIACPPRMRVRTRLAWVVNQRGMRFPKPGSYALLCIRSTVDLE